LTNDIDFGNMMAELCLKVCSTNFYGNEYFEIRQYNFYRLLFNISFTSFILIKFFQLLNT